MTAVFENLISSACTNTYRGAYWLAKTTDWYKLLQLPDVSWISFLVATSSLIVVIWIIVRLVSRVNEDVDPAEADREMLQALNDLRRGGDLTDDEFRLIKGQITNRLNTVWKATGRQEKTVKSRVSDLKDRLKGSTLEQTCESFPDSNVSEAEALNSEESETIASPTNLPEPSQDTDHLAQRLIASETEKGEGTTEPGSQENKS
jgi:hypothetical protein